MPPKTNLARLEAERAVAKKKVGSRPALVPPIERPKCPGTEGDGPGQWAWDSKLNRWMYTVSDEDMIRGRNERLTRENERRLDPVQKITQASVDDAQRFICKQVNKMTRRQIVRMLQALRFICHPDHSGSHEDMVQLNQLYDFLKD